MRRGTATDLTPPVFRYRTTKADGSLTSTVLRFDLHHLPTIEEFDFDFVATETCRVAALPTTSLHGALGHALLEQDRELYQDLCEPRPVETGGGVTTRAPARLVLRYRGNALDPTPLLLHEGDRLGFRLQLVGGAAIALRPTVDRCLVRAAERGLGLALRDKKSHAPFTLAGVHSLEPRHVPALPASAVLRVDTPLRLKEEGREAEHLSAGLLYSSALRRLDLLARHHGTGPILAGHFPEPSFHLSDVMTRLVRFQRYSDRQKHGMTWMGLVGTARLDFPGKPEDVTAWQILTLCERFGIGKGASLGFGGYRLDFDTAPVALDGRPRIGVPCRTEMAMPKNSPAEQEARAAAARYVAEAPFRRAFDVERLRLSTDVEGLKRAAHALGFELTPVGSAPKEAKRQGRASPPQPKASRSNNTAAGLDGRILAVLRDRGGLGKSALARALTVTVNQLTVPLRRLRQAGAIKQRGTTRAALYTAR